MDKHLKFKYPSLLTIQLDDVKQAPSINSPTKGAPAAPFNVSEAYKTNTCIYSIFHSKTNIYSIFHSKTNIYIIFQSKTNIYIIFQSKTNIYITFHSKNKYLYYFSE